MNLDLLQQKLITAARANPPGDHVPYAFEKRVMAQLAARPTLDAWALWSRALWRAAAPCLGLMFCLGIWAFVATGSDPTPISLADELEKTVLAGVDHLGDAL